VTEAESIRELKDEARHFALIGGPTTAHLAVTLGKALSRLGRVCVMSPESAMDARSDADYLAIMLDAGEIEDVPALVSALRHNYPLTPIVVLTSSPTWRRTRAAFEAGATDYLPTALSSQQWLDRMQTILAMQRSERVALVSDRKGRHEQSQNPSRR
jgi:DNA-binding response OmpR family regulator